MCGRMVIARAAGDLVASLGIDLRDESPGGESYNVAPTQTVPVLKADQDARRVTLESARWGLVPSWSRGPQGAPLINARAETVTAKPSFRSAVLKRRGLVPADGYYEWTSTASGKEPVYLHRPDDKGLLFAAVVEYWRDPADGQVWLPSLAIITRPAADEIGHVHDRSPVIVPESRLDEWLDPSVSDRATVEGLLVSLPEPHLTPTEVGKFVNSVKNDGPHLITAISR